MSSGQHDIGNPEPVQEGLKYADLIKCLKNLPPGLRPFNVTAVHVKSQQSTTHPQTRLLIACPRSGTSLLTRIFAEAPECAVASRISLVQDEMNDAECKILSKPEIVSAYNQGVENQSRELPTQNQFFAVLPPPINYTAAKPVFLVRDPVRVFDSWKHQGWTSVKSFIDCYLSLFGFQDKNVTPPVILVYEKLVQNPAAELSRLGEHWNVNFNTDISTFKEDFTTFTLSTEQDKILHSVDPPSTLFETVSFSSQVRVDIPPHSILSNQEIYNIEQRLGHLYLQCWKPEIKTAQTRLLQAKWFAFDLDDTLHEFKRASTAAISAVFSAILSEHPNTPHLTLETLKSAYAKVLKSKTASAFVDGKTSHEYREDRIRATLASCAINSTSAQITTWTALYETALMQNLELKCGVVDLFTTLKSMGKKIAVVTEGPQDAQERTIAQLGLTPFVDLLATTNRFGVAKTEGLFSRVVEKVGGVSAGEFVVVGDSFERDVVPARKVGMCCVHYDEKGGFEAGGEVLRVNTLKKLEILLGLEV